MPRKIGCARAWVLALLLLLGCGAADRDRGSEPVRGTTFSDESLNGTYTLSATISPYVKFARGPQIITGEVTFDNRGNVSGTVAYFGEPADLNGIYQVNPDGTGRMSYRTVARSDGATAKTELNFRIRTADEIEVESQRAHANARDWASQQNVIESGEGGVVGETKRKVSGDRKDRARVKDQKNAPSGQSLRNS